MLYLKEFQTEGEYNTYITGSTAFHPNTSIVEGVGVKYEKVLPAGAVDLGLPSGTLWHKYNLGANSETGYGDYFSWGETTPRGADWQTTAPYDWEHNPIPQSVTDWSSYIDSSYNLLPDYDVAHVQLGGAWRMPTSGHVQELIDNTNNEWVIDYQGSGIKGMTFTSKKDSSKSIFIPAAGYRYNSANREFGSGARLWISTLDSSGKSKAYDLLLGSGHCLVDVLYRHYGLCVRPVC